MTKAISKAASAAPKKAIKVKAITLNAEQVGALAMPAEAIADTEGHKQALQLVDPAIGDTLIGARSDFEKGMSKTAVAIQYLNDAGIGKFPELSFACKGDTGKEKVKLALLERNADGKVIKTRQKTVTKSAVRDEFLRVTYFMLTADQRAWIDLPDVDGLTPEEKAARKYCQQQPNSKLKDLRKSMGYVSPTKTAKKAAGSKEATTVPVGVFNALVTALKLLQEDESPTGYDHGVYVKAISEVIDIVALDVPAELTAVE